MKKFLPYIAALWVAAVSVLYYLQQRDKIEPLLRKLLGAP